LERSSRSKPRRFELKKAALIGEITTEHKLKKAETQESSGLAQAKLLGSLKKKPALNKVETAGEGLTEAQRKAFLEDQEEKKKTEASS
jgi:hypothetical protein